MQALRTPFAKSSTELIEALEADCLAAAFGWNHAAGRKKMISFAAAPRRNPNADVVYVPSLATLAALDRAVTGQVFRSATQHNLGCDLVYFEHIDAEKATASIVLIQLKIGATPICNAAEGSNDNRSMRAIANKLHAIGATIAAALAAQYDIEVTVRHELHTTSRLLQPARNEATNRGIEVYDAAKLWQDVWSADVKTLLHGLYGRRGRYFGATR
jgi:hypothetical protein